MLSWSLGSVQANCWLVKARRITYPCVVDDCLACTGGFQHDSGLWVAAYCSHFSVFSVRVQLIDWSGKDSSQKRLKPGFHYPS